MDPCWYVTASWGTHDERWIAALRAQGFEPRSISLERDRLTIEQVRQQLRDSANEGDRSPVLAGPLTSITDHLVGIPQRLVGLSWGFDLLDSDHGPDRLDQIDHLIVDSPASAQIAEAAGLSRERISQIYWGIDLDLFTADGPRSELTGVGIPESAHTVLSLRAHEDLYRVHDLIESWPMVLQQHQDAHLLIGNNGSLTESLKTRVQELSITDSVHFIGRIPERDLPPLFRAVDLYVSTSPIDGTSVTLLQAMACECPVLVTDAAGNRHWIEQGVGGYLYQPGNVRELGDSIAAALSGWGTDYQQQLIEASSSAVQSRADWKHNQRLLRPALMPTLT